VYKIIIDIYLLLSAFDVQDETLLSLCSCYNNKVCFY